MLSKLQHEHRAALSFPLGQPLGTQSEVSGQDGGQCICLKVL